jgi:hypothetical protein
MSLAACIPDLLAKGEITRAQADEMESLFGAYKRHYSRDSGPAADALASEATLQALERKARQKQRRDLLQVRAQREAWLAMQTYGTGAGGVRMLDPDKPGHLAQAAQALFARREFAPYRNVEHLQRAIRARAHSGIDRILQTHSRDIFGRTRDRAGQVELLREARGEATGNAAAKEMAGAWREAAEYLRRRANAAGADIGKIDDWGIPQSHDYRKLDEAGFEKWFADTAPLVDRGRMVDLDTGAPLDAEGFKALMRDIFETIRTDGGIKRQPGAMGEAALAKRLGMSRVLHFRDTDAWLAYADLYANRDGVFDGMMTHISLLSRDIALMEILGPNPAATMRWLSDALDKRARLTGDQRQREGTEQGVAQLQRLYETARGGADRPENAAMARLGGALRSFQVATKLGSAVLSTTTDQATGFMARKFNGIPAYRQAGTQLRLLNPANGEDRAFAMRMMLGAEEASQIAAGQARMTGEELTGEISRRVAETTLRASGLNAVTQAARWSFGMDFWAAASSWTGRSWDDLDPLFRGMFERHGLGERHWQAIRNAPTTQQRGVDWVMPGDIAEEGLADDIVQMIMREMDMAVPVSGLDVRAAIEGAAPKGTVIGEIVRTGFQFKAFPATIMLQQWRRTMALQGGWNRAKYAAQVFVLTTMAGAMALYLKDIAKGRDPRRSFDSEDPAMSAKFWGAAVAQGGGLGIFGDFLANSTNRFGGGFAGTLAGPAFQTVDSISALAIGEPAKALTGGNTNPGRKLVRLLESETPGGSLWQVRLAWERLVLDTLQQAIDPKAGESFRRSISYAEDQGTQYWWEPGAVDGIRSPDLGNVVGQ